MRKLHQTIKKVGDDIPALSYNTAIAAMMEYMNVVRRGERTPHRAEVEPLVQLVAPFAPHIAEELWEKLGHTESVFDSGWPAFDAALAAEELMTIAVQVNGKTRGTIQVAARRRRRTRRCRRRDGRSVDREVRRRARRRR